MSNIVKIREAHWFNREIPWWKRAMNWFDGLWWDAWGWKPLYWFRCHTFTRYHIIDIRRADGYKWGYTDPSFKLFAAGFKILEDFIENEKPFDTIDYEGGGQGDIEKELRELYSWWKEGRAKEHAEIDAILEEFETEFEAKFGKPDFLESLNNEEMREFRRNHPKWKEWSERHGKIDERDDEMLIRLCKIRGHLWT